MYNERPEIAEKGEEVVAVRSAVVIAVWEKLGFGRIGAKRAVRRKEEWIKRGKKDTLGTMHNEDMINMREARWTKWIAAN